MLTSTIATFICTTLLLPFASAAPANLEKRAVPLPSYSGVQRAILFPYYSTPWTFATNTGFYGSPSVKVKINGRESPMWIDTSAVGIMVPSTWIPNFSTTAPGVRRGFKHYNLHSAVGYWVPNVKLTLTDSTGKEHEVTLPVFGVTEVSRCDGLTGDTSSLTDCPSSLKKDTFKVVDNEIRAIANFPPAMGIGWDVQRVANGLSGTFDTLNLMHKIAALPPARSLGWAITKDGIYAGLDASATRNFQVQKLRANSQTNKDLAWTGLNALVSNARGTDGRKFSVRVILQTMFQASYLVTLPAAANFVVANDATRLPVTTEVYDETNGRVIASYTARPGNGPSWSTDSKPVVRIGAHVLQTRDYMYDAQNGYAGFRPRAA